jgi:hypothetical protein
MRLAVRGQAHKAVLLARKAGDYGEEAAKTAVKRMADEAQPVHVYLVQVGGGCNCFYSYRIRILYIAAGPRLPRPGLARPGGGCTGRPRASRDGRRSRDDVVHADKAGVAYAAASRQLPAALCRLCR